MDSTPTIWTTLQRLVAGDPRVLWVNRLTDRAQLTEPMRRFDCVYSTFGYIVGDEWPIVHIVETGSQIFTAAVCPPSWTRNQRRRLDRDVDRFAREMQRGDDGKVFACFELLDCDEVLPMLTEMVSARPATTH